MMMGPLSYCVGLGPGGGSCDGLPSCFGESGTYFTAVRP